MSDDKPSPSAPKVPGFPWMRLFGAAAKHIPAVRELFQTTLSGIERDPSLLKWVEQFQSVDQKDCLVCLAHQYGKKIGLSLGASPPEHWCPTRRRNAQPTSGPEVYTGPVCGCGKPAVRKAQFAGIADRDVCEIFPGCVPGQKVRSSGR